MRFLISLVLLLLFGSFALWGYVNGFSAQQQVSYATEIIEHGSLQKHLSATGKIKAVISVDVGSQVSGQISELFVDFNDVVRKGQPIAKLDQQSFIAKQQVAQASLESARSNVAINETGLERANSVLESEITKRAVFEFVIEREQALHNEAQQGLKREISLSKKGLSSSEKLEQAKSNYARTLANLHQAQAEKQVHEQRIHTVKVELKQAKAELTNARAEVPRHEAALKLADVMLERTIIRSPIDGVVIDRQINSGQTVAASLEAPRLFTLAHDLSQMEVHAQVDEADIGKVKQGQDISFTVDAYPKKRFSGKVYQIRKSPNTKNNVVSYKVVITTPNPDLLLLLGMTALVRITVYHNADVLLVPAKALHFRPEQSEARTGATVWQLNTNDEPQAISIKTGQSDHQYTEVLGGKLSAGSKVITNQEVFSEKYSFTDHRFWKKLWPNR